MGNINHPLTAWGSPTGAQRIPSSVVYEVTEWARSTDRTGATVVWNNVLQCAEVRLPLKAGDPRLRAFQEGKSPQDWEPVYLHRWTEDRKHKKGIPLEPSTVRSFLEEMDVQSGTGRFPNAIAAAAEAERHNEALNQSIKRAAKDNSAARAREHKRKLFGLPLVSVGADIGKRA